MKINSKIKSIKAREILDSRGNPTVEVELWTEKGVFFGSAPAGASVGKYEAVELRDGGKRYRGKGVKLAIKNIQKIIAPKLIGRDPRFQKDLDQFLISLDGTRQKSRLGVNAILPLSIAICRAGAAAHKTPLWKYILKLFLVRPPKKIKLPIPCFNIINGGAHAGNKLDLQEFMILPQFKSFAKNLQVGTEIYHLLKEILKENFGKGAINLGDEGGFAPPLSRTGEALSLIVRAIKDSGHFLAEVKIGLDCAASQFSRNGKYKLEGAVFTREGLLNFYQNLVKNYPILLIEDPFSEEDWQGFSALTKLLSKKVTIVGDDLLVTNPERIREANQKKACTATILKVNQIGTVSEALEAAKLAKEFGWKIIVSHRSGETNDDFIADLAVGIGADFIKAGAPARGERVAKYNRLLRIEEEL